MKFSKTLIITLVIVGAVLLCGLGLTRMYNTMVTTDEGVTNAWAQVENVYQRRADLIPNLVNTVKGAADFEKSTLTAVVEARAAATAVKIDPTNLSPEKLASFQKAQDGLSSAISRLLVSVERYPELKANQNFMNLQAQLEGTENRITVERNKFNETVKVYNTLIRRFPRNLLANLFGFEKKGYFQAKEGAENAPEVEFDFAK
ncbi:MAG: LemA family protein [Bacteroidales bacterium]